MIQEAVLLQPALFRAADIGGYWLEVPDGNAAAFGLHERHYSHYVYKDGRRNQHGYRNRRLIVGPGEKLLLLGVDGASLCCWRRGSDASSTGSRRIYCTVLRNEGVQQTSTILLEAMALAWQRWGTDDLWTYVDGEKIRSTHPGYCFLMAGWQWVGRLPGRTGIGRTAEGKVLLKADYRLALI